MFFILNLLKWYLITRYRAYFFDRKKLQLHQEKRAKILIRFAIKKSKFYRKFYQGQLLHQWKCFPLMNKKLFMENFDSLNTRNSSYPRAYQTALQAEKSRDFSPKLQGVTVGLSSGTTGSRGIFLISNAERSAWAGAILAKMLPEGLFARHRIAFFLRANSNIYTSLNGIFIKFRFYDLLDDIENHIKNLNQFNPSILVAPPSMLKILALEKNTGKLNISPQKIIAVAEVLESQDEMYIKKSFNTMVHQIYQATEGFIAASCKYGKLHLNEDLLVIQREYVDDQKIRFVPIVTDLYRKIQPIIRYRLNDILMENHSLCPCGSPCSVVEQIDGRCDDLMWMQLAANRQLKPLFPDFIRRIFAISSAEIVEYSVVQNSFTQLQINLLCAHGLNDDIKNKVQDNLSSLFKEQGGIIPNIIFGEYIPPKKGEKLRRIKRSFNISEAE